MCKNNYNVMREPIFCRLGSAHFLKLAEARSLTKSYGEVIAIIVSVLSGFKGQLSTIKAVSIFHTKKIIGMVHLIDNGDIWAINTRIDLKMFNLIERTILNVESLWCSGSM